MVERARRCALRDVEKVSVRTCSAAKRGFPEPGRGREAFWRNAPAGAAAMVEKTENPH
jgi:hypothetical protein